MLLLKKLPQAMMCIGLHGLCALAHAADDKSHTASAAPESGQLADIAVQDDQLFDATPATLTVITRDDLQTKGARNIKDALRDEVDVVVRSRPSQFSATRSSTGRARNESINIRGIEGNRVLIVQDGIRVPNGFSFGPAFQTGRGDYWDVEALRRIEILRGANSTQYGADSIAGVVSASTLGVDEVVKADRATGGFVQSAYAQQDNSFSHTAAVGFRQARWDGMFMAGMRDGHEGWTHETDRRPDRRRNAANPENLSSRYQLGKLGLKLDPGKRLQATLENLSLQVATDVLTEVSPQANFRATRALKALDTTRRQRASLDYFQQGEQGDWLDKLHAHLYWQQASVRQFTKQTVFGPVDWIDNMFFASLGAFPGSVAPGVLERTRDNRYRERTLGLNVVADSTMATGSVEHRLRYGFDVSRAQISAALDGTVPSFLHQFPQKPSPDSSYTLAGAFLQDEIAVGNVKVTPGLRFDSYRISPDASSLSAFDRTQMIASGVTLKSNRGSAFTPRLGLMWEIAPAFIPYFTYAQGFRAPAPDQVNAYFSNAALRYTYTGNPNLRPERVTGMELGVRGRIDGFSYTVLAFDSRYRDFMERRMVGLELSLPGSMVFRTLNQAEAHVRGAEIRTQWDLTPAWRLNAALAYARGDVKQDAAIVGAGSSVTFGPGQWQPLNSVQPMRTIMGMRYRQAGWGAHANLEHAWGKRRDRIATSPSNADMLVTAPYTTVNAGAWIKPWEAFTVTLNIENLFNAHYERWSDAGELPVQSGPNGARRRYTATPRSLQLALRYAF